MSDGIRDSEGKRQSAAQAAIEELRTIKDRCAQYAEDLRIANKHADECRTETLAALKKLADVEQANRLARDLLAQSEAERERLKDWIKAANQFVWAHEKTCPRSRSDESCNCGLDEFLGCPRPFVESFKSERDRLARELAEARKDAMIAHRWFAKHFGEVMNGRDFAVKCPMATEMLADARHALWITVDELCAVQAAAALGGLPPQAWAGLGGAARKALNIAPGVKLKDAARAALDAARTGGNNAE